MKKDQFRLDVLRILDLPSDTPDEFETAMDSLQVLEICAYVENNLGIVVDAQEIAEMKTVALILGLYDLA